MPDISSREASIKSGLTLAPSPFEIWAAREGYDVSPAVSPTPTRVYAGRRTQEAFDAWTDGAQSVARMFTESTVETEALREKVLKLASCA